MFDKQKNGTQMHARPEHFFKAFEHCLRCKMTKNMAMIMGEKFSKLGMVDASEGCYHYALRVIEWQHRREGGTCLT